MESNSAPKPRRSAGRAAPITLGVLVALAVVTIASRGSTALGEAGTRRPADTLLDILFTFYLLLLVAGAIFFVYLLAVRKAVKRSRGIDTLGRVSLLVVALLLLVGLVAARRLQGLELSQDEVEVPVQAPPLLPETTSTPTSDAYEPEFAWIPVLVLLGLLLLGLGAAALAARRRRRARDDEAPTLGEALADVLDETLDALRAERDSRRAVIAAYARLERVLAAHGLARRPADAPLEYLARVLGDLSVTPDAVQRLTLLFERAKFSHHEVDEPMKEDAIEALMSVQDELRAAQALEQRERETRAAERAQALR